MPKRQLFFTAVSQAPGTSAGDSYISEPIDITVWDVTSQTPAVLGKLLTMQFTSTNQSGQNYSQNATANVQVPEMCYGVVTVPAAAQGAQAELRQIGTCQALCVTNVTSSITPGQLLVADNAGNLTASTAAPTFGTVLAISLGTVATGSTTAVKNPVVVANM